LTIVQRQAVCSHFTGLTTILGNLISVPTDTSQARMDLDLVTTSMQQYDQLFDGVHSTVYESLKIMMAELQRAAEAAMESGLAECTGVGGFIPSAPPFSESSAPYPGMNEGRFPGPTGYREGQPLHDMPLDDILAPFIGEDGSFNFAEH
jgi:hypothetical protein